MPIVSIVQLDEAGNPCNDEEKSFEIKENDVIYDALSDQGFELPHGCLSGSCGACRILVVEGQDNLQIPSYIENDTVQAVKEGVLRDKGESFVKDRPVRLSCRARATGDIKIALL